MRRVLMGVLLLSAVAACSESPLQVADQPQTKTLAQPQFTVVGDGATWSYEATVYLSTWPGVNIGDRIAGTVVFETFTGDMYPEYPYYDGRLAKVTFTYTVNGQPHVVSNQYGWTMAMIPPDAWTPIFGVSATTYPVETQLQLRSPGGLEFPLTPPALDPLYNEFAVTDYGASPYKYYRAHFTMLRGDAVKHGDSTPPVITPTVTGEKGSNDWYRSNVNISWTVTDPESAITSPPCQPSVIDFNTDGVVRYCFATSAGGSNWSSVFVKRDATPPVVEFAGNTGTYLVDQYIWISCSARDPLSGVATWTCPELAVPAYTLEVGEHTLNANVADYAGNVTLASTTFNVVVDVNSLSNLINQWVPQRGVANSLQTKLKQKDATAFLNELRAQTGKLIAEENAQILGRLAVALLGE